MSGFITYLGEVIANINYRRPDYVTMHSNLSKTSRNSSMDLAQTQSKASGKLSQGIPEALSFDNIINGGTCPPITVREFMNYLEYIERAPENLQFFLWFRDYTRRFEKSKPSNPFSTPPATAKSESKTFDSREYQNDSAVRFHDGAEDDRSIDKTKSIMNFPPQIIAPWETDFDNEGGFLVEVPSSAQDSYRVIAKKTFDHVDIKIPDTNLPYRDEIDRIIAIYIADDGSRQLNLSSRQRTSLLECLSTTTHPTAFKPIIETVEYSLRRQAHPNFVRWSICNGNRPRQIFAKGLGISLVILGWLYAILITLSNMSRGWRAFSAVFWALGISTLYAALQGMCVVLHGLHHRHLRPWELWESEESAVYLEDESRGGKDEEYPWIKKYEKRFIIRKIFDREVWVQEPALRQIQDIIFLQSVLTGLGVAAILTAIFLAVPGGHFF
ncbi:hypothetical protein DSL72_006463 [Monilinia vaccinii-corymbosi]|uniref:RGS domain-containing protein n=1 Tax=Monilinia vaccinii-corymbosi TaxID=61207 RepID=A0A8A3PNJ5_9HELO|nr:hypothetical protein DSL72_006463 [Monilinia vaccinii-corymbosi]